MAERTIGAGFIGKAPGAFVSKTTQQSHRGLTLFMAGIGLVVVLTAKNSNGETYVAAAINWIRKATTGTITASPPGGAGVPPPDQSTTSPAKSPTGTAPGEVSIPFFTGLSDMIAKLVPGATGAAQKGLDAGAMIRALRCKLGDAGSCQWLVTNGYAK